MPGKARYTMVRRPQLAALPTKRITSIPPPESILQWWNPSRPGVRSGPAWFDRKLDEVGDPGELAVTWNSYIERYQVWVRAPRISNKYVKGWNLLFVVKNEDGSYRPLDERTLARLYSCSMKRWPSAVHYFDAIMAAEERAKQDRQKAEWNDTRDRAMESFDHSQIKVGYGPSSGSKFQRYHS